MYRSVSMYFRNLSERLQGMLTGRHDGRQVANSGSHAAQINMENVVLYFRMYCSVSMYFNNFSERLQGMLTRRHDGRPVANRGPHAACVSMRNTLL